MNTINSFLTRFEQLNEIGTALSSEHNINRLLEKILIAAQQITFAEGGTLYLIDENNRQLKFEILRNSRLDIALGGTSGNPIPFAPLPLFNPYGSPNKSMVAAWCAWEHATINIPDAYTTQDFDFSGTRAFDASTGYQSRSFLTVPMQDHENELIGVLQLINAVDQHSGEIVAFSAKSQRLAESLASQASIAITNRQLILQQEKLFEAFIDMINCAIDDKSKYTGGHCQRVPILTMMLADAVEKTDDGPFASFTMAEQDRYALKIAGLLHDCGKITTPVHVVDKATKLETIYDRIDLVDTRFEVLKRDAEIALLKAKLALREPSDPEKEAGLENQFRTQIEQQRVQEIGTGSQWTNPEDHNANFLTANEIENLTIR